MSDPWERATAALRRVAEERDGRDIALLDAVEDMSTIKKELERLRESDRIGRKLLAGSDDRIAALHAECGTLERMNANERLHSKILMQRRDELKEALGQAVTAIELLRAELVGGSDLTADQVLSNLNLTLRHVSAVLGRQGVE